MAGHAHAPLRMTTLLGEYPNTAALRRGEVGSPWFSLDFDPAKKPAHAFKRVVRDMAFDIAELSVGTFLIAKAHGVPLVLMPAVMFSRFQHPYLVYNPARGPLAPQDLAGRRIGVPYYTTTTAIWVRAILAEDFGVDVSRIQWVALEAPHVAQFEDPPNVVRAPEGSSLAGLLLAGEVDAIISPPPMDPRFTTVIADPDGAAAAWRARHQGLQLNHMVVVKSALTRSDPELVREFFRLLVASKHAAGLPAPGQTDMVPTGLEANRHNLEIAIATVHRQGLIPRAYAVDELFDDVTAALA